MTKRIKRVEMVSEKEFDIETNPIGKIMKKFRNWSKWRADAEGYPFKFIYTDHDGNLVEHTFNKILVGCTDFFKDTFNEDSSLCVVKIWYDDGTTDWGFKWFREKYRLYKKNGLLRSLYLKDGTYTKQIPEFGEVEECYDRDSDSRIPAWVLELLPMYNEKIREMLESDTVFHEDFLYLGHTMGEWEIVKRIAESSYVGKDVDFAWVKKPNGERVGVNWAMTDIREVDYYLRLTTWEDNVCVNESGSLKKGLETVYKPVLSAYTYMKSIYEDMYRREAVHHVFAMGDLLSVQKKDARDGENPEVWNNLDETVVGNV